MTAAVGVYPTSTSAVIVGGQSVVIIYGPVLGGYVVNPATAADQGIATAEPLYVDVIGPATLGESPTTVSIQPGQSYNVPPNQSTNVSVNAVTSGHRFSAITFQPVSPAVPAELLGATNPCLQEVIPSYLYKQYSDDDDLQAFVSAYNAIAQEYVAWLNDVMLPVYTSPTITGSLLDWVALGLYGVVRPVLSAGSSVTIGPLNTYVPNVIAMNAERVIQPAVFTPVTDDIFKRILTWKLYKGDGKTIDIRWLKRRVLRFLLGADGTDVNTADTQQISVTFSFGSGVTLTVVTDTYQNIARGAFFNRYRLNTDGFNVPRPGVKLTQTIETYQHGNQIDINLLSRVPTSIAGSFFNQFGLNGRRFNDYAATFRTFSPLPNVEVFKEAIEQGVLDMPFQFDTVVNVT